MVYQESLQADATSPNSALRCHYEVDTVLVGLLRICAKPEPLHRALSRLSALSGGQVCRHCHTELCVVERQLGQVLVRVGVKDQQGLDHGVCCRVDKGDVARSLVRNRKLGGELDNLSWCVLLDVLLVVCELCALAKTDVAFR